MFSKTGELLISPQRKLYGLDHVRALAIAFVFIYDYSRQFASPDLLIDRQVWLDRRHQLTFPKTASLCYAMLAYLSGWYMAVE